MGGLDFKALRVYGIDEQGQFKEDTDQVLGPWKKKKKIETLLLKKEKIEALCKLSQTQKLRYLP